jgi:hypothetical protein
MAWPAGRLPMDICQRLPCFSSTSRWPKFRRSQHSASDMGHPNPLKKEKINATIFLAPDLFQTTCLGA